MTIIHPRLKLGLALTALSAVLAACAPNPTPYGAAQGRYGYGFGEQQIEQNRFRVTFSGNSDTPRSVVENYLLYRAAEITKAQGYDYFVVANDDTEPNTRYRGYSDGFGGYGSFGYWRGGPFFGVGASYGDAYPVTRYTSYADIVLMRGAKDPTNVRAFTASEVLARIGPTLVRPQP